MKTQGLQKLNRSLIFILAFLAWGLSGCNLFDNKIQGQIGQSAGTIGSGRPKLSERIGLTSQAPEYVFDEGSRQDVEVIFSKALTKETTFNWSIEGGADDFNTASGTLTVPAGEQSFQIALIAMNDGLYEGDENFNLVVDVDEDFFAADLVVPLKILEKSATPPQLSFASLAQTASEASGTLNVVVNLSQPAASLIKVALVTSGTATVNSDFTMSPPKDLVFSPGETSKTIEVTIIDDTVDAEGLEDVTITLDRIDVGTAVIDPANKAHSILIEDNDQSPSPITITGVTSPDSLDNVTDAFLTSGTHPTIRWTAPTLSNETSFDVTVYEANGVTIRCPPQNVASDSTFAHFPSCTLSEGSVYKVSVVANLLGGGFIAAANNMYPFRVNTVPPGAFTTLGAMGGNDIVPDGFLAGSLYPTIVWKDAAGETKYDVKVLNSLGNSFDSTNCEVSNVPANSVSYTFEKCLLIANTKYRAQVIAKNDAGLSYSAPPVDFLVTNNQSGYLVLGVTGGTGDTTPDENMDDGSAPRVHWQKALNAEKYKVTIKNINNTAVVCTLPGDGTVGGNINEITFPTCNLNLHDQYNVVVESKTFAGVWSEAANSPYPFRHRVGLYIDGTGGSYINGLTITSCDGIAGDECNANKPYKVSDVANFDKIRISNSGVMTGLPWTGNTATNGNGILTVVANYLTLDTGGKITMTGKGYTAGLGPGAGSSAGSYGIGASHGGLSGLVNGGSQGPAYGDVLNPNTMGSGGRNGGGGTVGGAGGGVINITVNNALELNSSNVVIEANGGQGTSGSCLMGQPYCSNGGGGGSGGSINIVVDKVTGVSGAKISSKGGTTTRPGTYQSRAASGGGGRIAFRYRLNTFPGGAPGLLDASGGKTEGYIHAVSYSAAGTIFYKDESLTSSAGNLLVSQSDASIPHVQGVETPMPVNVTFDSIRTVNNATLIISSTDVYTHFNNYIDFRLVVAGDLQIPATGTPSIKHLQVGKDAANPGMLEWRRLTPIGSPSYDKVTVVKNSVLTHSKNSTMEVYRLVIDTATVDILGAIDVTGRGFGMENGPGSATGYHGASYGGLGGLGSSGLRRGVYGVFTTPVELGSGGSTMNAGGTNLGTGGGSVEIKADTLNLEGEPGGGSKVYNTGTIRADGAQGDVSGGSGGSIKIVAKQVFGKYATLSSNGGSGSSGGGSGGRIAIYYDRDEESGSPTVPAYIWSPLSSSPLVELSARGGSGSTAGAAGTMYLKKTDSVADTVDEPKDTNGHLWVYNLPNVYDERVTTVLKDSLPLDSIKTDSSGTVHIPSGLSILLPTNTVDYRLVAEGDYVNPNPPNFIIDNAGYLEWRKASPMIITPGGKFTIENNGVLTHSRNTATRQYTVNVIADDMLIKGKVDAKGKGYAYGYGPGAPPDPYWGAAHAGVGSDGQSPRTGSGTPYGIADAKAPYELGSGGRCANGGGAIRLNITNKLEFGSGIATLDASAPDAQTTCPAVASGIGGGGSGGSIHISAQEIAGTKDASTRPIITANGGAGGYWVFCGACSGFTTQNGSGGRIAIETTKDSITGLGLLQAIRDKNIKAIGGEGRVNEAAAAGTIYVKRIKDINDVAYTKTQSLYLDNSTLNYYDRIETPVPEGVFDEIVTLGNATLVVTSSQIYTLNPSTLEARLVVAGIFSTSDTNLTIKNGGYLQWRRNTPLILNTLTVENGANVTHTSNFSDAQYRLELDLQNLELKSGGTINLDGKGYQAGAGPGGGVTGNRTNTAAAYGGNSRSALAYGSVSLPADLGSGGGTNTDYNVIGGSGGGNAQIRVAQLADIAGVISANGGGAAQTAGSGGTVLLDVNQLKLSSGYGFQAKGGTASKESGTGGRISIRYKTYTVGAGGPVDVQSAARSSQVLASGGTGTAASYGAAGTIYYRDVDGPGDALGHLVVKNDPNPYSETTTPFIDQTEYDSIFVDPKAAVEVRLGEFMKLPSSTLNYRLVLGGVVNTPSNILTVDSNGILEVRRGAVVNEFSEITVQNGGVITHTGNVDLKKYWLDIYTSKLTVTPTGKINVNGKGYAAAYGPSPGCSVFSNVIYGGGTHAGFGSLGDVGCARKAYGSVKNPTDMGSGGGSYLWNDTLAANQPGGPGGGLIKLYVTDTLTLNGDVTADGEGGACSSATACGGGGAGGSVNIFANKLAGTTTAKVTVNGGIRASGTEGGAGGGGRISLTVNDDTGFAGTLMSLPVQARSGTTFSAYPGAAGTIWRKRAGDTNGHLLITNLDSPYASGAVTELFTNEGFDSVTIGNSPSERARTGIGVRKATSFEFKTSILDFPLVAAGSPQFTGFGGHLGNMTVKSGGIFEAQGDQEFFFNNIVVQNGGVISHLANGSTLSHLLKIKANSLTIENGGAIDVSSKGYSAGAGPGAGGPAPWHLGAGGGASFGGVGGNFATKTGGAGGVYGTDDLLVPTLGSGGGQGSNNCYGGAGGGGVILDVVTLDLQQGGHIMANGGMGQNITTTGGACHSGGGGSGGFIKVKATNFTTNNTNVGSRIEARGGGIQNEGAASDSAIGGELGDGGGGGGGRVSVEFTSGVTPANIQTWTLYDGGGSEGSDRNGTAGTLRINGVTSP